MVVGIFCCQIYIGCSETKLLICHKGGSSFMGRGSRLTRNAYFAYVVRGVGGLEAKCKILILIPLKRAFKFVKYHFSL